MRRAPLAVLESGLSAGSAQDLSRTISTRRPARAGAVAGHRSGLPSLRRLAALAGLLAAAACGESPVDPGTGGGNPPAVASVVVSPGALQLVAGESRTLTAAVTWADGRPATGAHISWLSSDPSVARVDGAGNLLALRGGTAVVSASSGGKRGEAEVVVSSTPANNVVATVEIQGTDLTVDPGKTLKLSVVLKAPDGSVLQRPVQWSTTNESRAWVTWDGTVYGHAGGEVVITATAEGKSGQARVRVTEWYDYPLVRAQEQALPWRVSTETLYTEHGTRYDRTVEVVGGRFRLSTVSDTYQQELTLRVTDLYYWQVDGEYVPGWSSSSVRTLRDEGTAGWSDYGTFRYTSTLIDGHEFFGSWNPQNDLYIIQKIGGQGDLRTFVFDK
ncbi:MAG TPA: Ig-like domain-containing protein [Longimicrobium sp.]|nr:Ig-like domain-containing protein [Longimicrobium sp.]